MDELKLIGGGILDKIDHKAYTVAMDIVKGVDLRANDEAEIIAEDLHNDIIDYAFRKINRKISENS